MGHSTTQSKVDQFLLWLHLQVIHHTLVVTAFRPYATYTPMWRLLSISMSNSQTLTETRAATPCTPAQGLLPNIRAASGRCPTLATAHAWWRDSCHVAAGWGHEWRDWSGAKSQCHERRQRNRNGEPCLRFSALVPAPPPRPATARPLPHPLPHNSNETCRIVVFSLGAVM